MLGQKLIGDNYSRTVNVLIFIFPIVINSLQVAGDLVLFLLAMMGIFIAISQKLSPFSIKEIKFFSYLTVYYFIAVCLSVLFSGQAGQLAHYIPRDLHFLFAPFIALALYKAEINFKYLLMGVKVALIILGIIVFYEITHGAAYRSTGLMNANVFGNLSVSLFFIALFSFQRESFKHNIFTLLSLFSGLFIIVESGSRGSWVSFMLLLGVCLYFLNKKYKSRIKSKISIAFVIIIVLFAIGLNQNLKNRFHDMSAQISSVIAGENNLSSIGIRLEMYKLAIEKIEDVPFFGHGYRTSNIVVFQNAKSYAGRLSYTFNHLHNAYLTNYFNGGIVLLGALLLLLFAPFRIFIKANSQDHKNPIFILGILLTLGYASFGLVNILFGDTYMNGFYVFFLAIFLLLTNKSIKAQQD